MMRRSYVVSVGGQTRSVELEEADGRVRAFVDGREAVLDVKTLAPGRYAWLEGARSVTVDVDGRSPKLSVTVGGHSIAVEVADAQAALASAAIARAATKPAGPAAIRAPMPGRVVKILVRAGETVVAGRGAIVVEAMKMENEIKAPRAGTVAKIAVAEGAAVEAGQELIVIE
jgi:biotin carboxyl carrier protein